jgi:hypothetical protein
MAPDIAGIGTPMPGLRAEQAVGRVIQDRLLQTKEADPVGPPPFDSTFVSGVYQ